MTEWEPDGEFRWVFGKDYKYRKYVGLLTESLMTQLIRDQDLDWGGPGETYGVVDPEGQDCLTICKAIVFRGAGAGYYLAAWITPYVLRGDGKTPLRKSPVPEGEDWFRFESAFCARYISGYRSFQGPYTVARNARLERERQEALQSA